MPNHRYRIKKILIIAGIMFILVSMTVICLVAMPYQRTVDQFPLNNEIYTPVGPSR